MSGQVGVVDNLFSSLDLNKTESRAKPFSVGLMVWLELPLRVNTVEPPNKGQVGAWALVHYSGVVLYWGVFVKKPFLCVVSVYS